MVCFMFIYHSLEKILRSRKRMKRQLWNDDFEKAIQHKKAMKKMRDSDRNESTIKKKKNKLANKGVKRAVAFLDLFNSLDSKDRHLEAIRIAKQRVIGCVPGQDNQGRI